MYYLKTNNEQELWEALEAVELAVKDYNPEDELNVRPEGLEMDAAWAPSGEFTWRFTGQFLDIIGTIYKETGNMLTTDEGIEYPEMVAIEGFHANMMGSPVLSVATGNMVEDADGILIPEVITRELPVVDAPKTPYRVLA